MAHPLLCRALLLGEGVQLVNEPLGMYPTQRMVADIELPRIIAEDDSIVHEAVRPEAAP